MVSENHCAFARIAFYSDVADPCIKSLILFILSVTYVEAVTLVDFVCPPFHACQMRVAKRVRVLLLCPLLLMSSTIISLC